jgi:hypothetical protein
MHTKQYPFWYITEERLEDTKGGNQKRISNIPREVIRSRISKIPRGLSETVYIRYQVG